MSFSEFQYSNKRVISAGEIWTAERFSLAIDIRDVLGQGRQLTVELSNPLNTAGENYFDFQRVRLLDRPTNAIIFIGRVISKSNDHRRQKLTVVCSDYSQELATKTVALANIYGNRRSDIIHDVISGGTEVGRTRGNSSELNRIVDDSKKFTSDYLNRAVKVPGIGPGLVTGVANTNDISDSTAPFDNSFLNRLIRRVSFGAGRKQIEWEGRVTVVVSNSTLTVTANGIDSEDSGQRDYTGIAHGFASAGSQYWEIVGFEGKITTIVASTEVDVATVGSTSSPSYKGYKDANFYNWGLGSVLSAKGGVQYFIESAEEGVPQVTLGQGHASDKSIDLSRIDSSPYMEYIRRSYSAGQGSSEGVREIIQRLARDEVWEVPQVLFFGGHLGSSEGDMAGVATNEWMLMTAEANTSVDVLYKPIMAPLPLQKRLVYTGGTYDLHARAVTNPAGANPRRVSITNQAGTGISSTVINNGTGMLYDETDSTKNRIQIGNEVRRVTSAPTGNPYRVNVDKPFTNTYTASDDVVVGIGPNVGSPRWDRNVSVVTTAGAAASIGNPELVVNGTFGTGATPAGWVAAPTATSPSLVNSCTLDGTNGHLVLTATVSGGNTEAYCYQTITGLTVGRQYIFSVEVARYAGGTDAAKRRIKVGTAPATYSSGWSNNGYDAYVNVDDAPSNTNAYSTSNRLAWTQYSYEFKAVSSIAYINLGVSDANNDRARFDSVSLREAAYDSRLYIGSPTIFNGIKFEMESSTDAYSSMDVEFWGRNIDNPGTFGWHRVEKYTLDDRQNTGMGDAFWDPPGDRGIDNFNRSGTIKWYDISYTGSSNHLSQTAPNIEWNHWAKDSLVGSEPLYGDAINTLSTTKHNHSLEGGIKVTDLADPELEKLYWVRISVPSNEIDTALDSTTNPGFIRNIRIMDARKSAFNTEQLPNPPGHLGHIYDTTERHIPQSQWDFRMEDPGFFTAIGQVTVDNSPDVDTWTDYTTNMTTRSSSANMEGFSNSFKGAGKYYYFGADYKFSGVEFNLSTVGSALAGNDSPLFEYWNGKIWAGIQDLHEYDFSASGSARWDMDAIDSLESQVTSSDNKYPSYFSQTKWVKRDLRATSAAWGSYNYTIAGNTSSVTPNPYKPPNSAGAVQTGDAGGSDYPGGADGLNALTAPHHHLYWIRMSRPTTGSITTPAKITTVRMFSRPAFKYFERGTEPWDFNVTGTEGIDSVDYGKHEFSDADGQFLISPASGNVWVKNTSAADYNQANSTYVSASKLGLQPALSRGGVGLDTTYKVSDVVYSGINNSTSTIQITGPSPKNKANELKVDQYLLIDSERMRILSLGEIDENGVITLEVERNVHGTSAAAHTWATPVYLLKRTSDLSARVFLSAGLFIHGETTTDYKARAGSNYLLYQDKRPGLKNFETYGGATSSIGNWHGVNIKYKNIIRPEGMNLYRYGVSEVPVDTVTRVIVNGVGTVSATAVDTDLEALYGMRQDRTIFDRTIKSAGEAATVAESILASLKPLKEHTAKRVVLEIYDYPVYSYNSATTSTIDRDIPHVVRAGDVITVSIADGSYRFFDEPFLVQSIVYDDRKSLAKITCSQGMFPIVMDSSSPYAQNYAIAKDLKDQAQEQATAKKTTLTEGGDGEAGFDASTKAGTTAVGFTFKEPDTEITRTAGEVSSSGALTLAGDMADITLTAAAGSGLNKFVVASSSNFVARGGFTATGTTATGDVDWKGRWVVDSSGKEFQIDVVQGENAVTTLGQRTWAVNDVAIFRRRSSAAHRLTTEGVSGDIATDNSLLLYYDRDAHYSKVRSTSQVPNPNEITNSLWATMLSGFHGVRLTTDSGLLVISLAGDHGYSQGFFHKPLVLVTIDPTTGTGAANSANHNQRAYAVVKRFTDTSGTETAAQWGTAGSSSGSVVVGGLNTQRLFAQANNNSVSTFNASHLNNTVQKLNANNGVIEEGTVTAVEGPTQLRTSGTNLTGRPPLQGWKVGDKYVVYGDVQKIEIQVYVPRMSLAVATSAATDSVLVDTSGNPFTSNNETTIIETAEDYSGTTGIAVAYVIIPRESRSDLLPGEAQ